MGSSGIFDRITGLAGFYKFFQHPDKPEEFPAETQRRRVFLIVYEQDFFSATDPPPQRYGRAGPHLPARLWRPEDLFVIGL
ncbi:MAG: hypothetical protein ABII06_21115 [Pseudomonadota bacterium]